MFWHLFPNSRCWLSHLLLRRLTLNVVNGQSLSPVCLALPGCSSPVTNAVLLYCYHLYAQEVLGKYLLTRMSCALSISHSQHVVSAPNRFKRTLSSSIILQWTDVSSIILQWTDVGSFNGDVVIGLTVVAVFRRNQTAAHTLWLAPSSDCFTTYNTAPHPAWSWSNTPLVTLSPPLEPNSARRWISSPRWRRLHRAEKIKACFFA